MNLSDEFYVGWEDKAPVAIGKSVWWAGAVLLVLAAALGVAFAVVQGSIGVSTFEWGTVKKFSGIFRSNPYPHLLVRRPGMRDEAAPYSSYYLVKPFKFGIDPEIAARFDRQRVNLRGTLIYRDGQTMVEVFEDSLQLADVPSPRMEEDPTPVPVALGVQSFVGEIVDSKCYLGVMNPGALTPHRACAIRCISGGIPPVLLVRQTNGTARYLLLSSRDGKPVNRQVLDLVAEPVEITGEVERQGDLLILRSDPTTYRRVERKR